jgi:Rad3-related DNA helicase
MAWSLYEKDQFLEPLKFSNGKTQKDVVKEVLDKIKSGHKIIFIHGVCGTGKSAIALNIARNLGKTSVVVPGKNLQAQYKKDYEGDKYLLKDKKEKLKISVITGRNNHECKFLRDNDRAIPKIKKEIDSSLNDIFEFSEEEENEKNNKDFSADNFELPCKIEIKEKNFRKIKEYLRKNKNINLNSFLTIQDVKRVPVASVCPYWYPVLPEEYELKTKEFESAKKRKFEGLEDTKFVIYQRKPGCKFYDQFDSYIDSDVIVFNSLKYKLETALNRKPKTEVEIIDECDDFLDSFSNSRKINLDRLLNSLSYIFSSEKFVEKIQKEITEIIHHLKRNLQVNESIDSGKILPLKQTGVYDLLKIFSSNPDFFSEIDDESYLFDVEETAKMFKDFVRESYVTFSKIENSLSVSIVTTNLAKKFKELLDKNKIFVLMSGTLHSEKVLKEIFGLEDFVVIEAETSQQGQIEVVRTGLEMDCKYSNFSNGKNSREGYLLALSKCVEVSKKPSLVHVNSFSDLPSENELQEFDIDNLISREKLKELQKKDKTGQAVERFKKNQMDVLFSTRSTRGVDFPGEQCNSIIFTKYPNPNVKDAFWKILNKTHPNHYWDFYKDKAKRELYQRIYRGLRFQKDHIYLLSPDVRVLDVFEKEL